MILYQGQKIKRVGIDARKDIEKFVDKQVHLELYVKVDKDWRGSDKKLDKLLKQEKKQILKSPLRKHSHLLKN